MGSSVLALPPPCAEEELETGPASPGSSVRDLLSSCGGAVEHVHVDLVKIVTL